MWTDVGRCGPALWRAMRSFYSEMSEREELLVSEDCDSSWVCNNCDYCMRDESKLEPRSFEYVALVVLLMVEKVCKGIWKRRRTAISSPASSVC